MVASCSTLKQKRFVVIGLQLHPILFFNEKQAHVSYLNATATSSNSLQAHLVSLASFSGSTSLYTTCFTIYTCEVTVSVENYIITHFTESVTSSNLKKLHSTALVK